MLRLFLSYARGDDEPFVASLYQRLRSAGFSLWWDRADMPSRGRTFLQEIRDAIDACDKLVLVVGPAAMGSDYVRAEWQYALTAGKVITPILRLGDYKLLPAELRNLECPDSRKSRAPKLAEDHLLRVLRQPPPPLGALFGSIPDMPPHFQPQLNDLTALADHVLFDTRRPAVTVASRDRITIAHGMPGAGKTSLAAAFARSTETRRAFPDGIIWANVGSEPSIEKVADVVCESLEGSPSRLRRADITAKLRRALDGKASLIILDDAWSIEAIEMFLNALSLRSRVLVTTRDAGLGSSLGALEHAVGLLDESASLRHLSDWTGVPVEDLPSEAAEIARECGFLPFALALCGAMASDGLSWTDLLANLKRANLRFFEKRLPNYPHTNLLRAMAVSLKMLGRERKAAVDCYRSLAVFPAGEVIPVAAVARLWRQTNKLDESESKKILAMLRRKSLLRMSGPSGEAIALHDLQWDYLTTANAHPKLLHLQLIRAYEGFETGKDDGYIFNHITWHLAEAGERKQLYALVNRNWFELQFSREDSRRVFRRDLDRLIRLAQTHTKTDLPQLVRGCLIQATVADLAIKAPPAAIYALARCGQSAKALDYAMLGDDDGVKIDLWSLVAAGLKDRGEHAAAVAMARQVLELGLTTYGERPDFHAWAAKLLAEVGDSGARELIARATAAVKANPGHFRASVALVDAARAAHLTGQLREAERLLSRADHMLRISNARIYDCVNNLALVADGWIQLGLSAKANDLISYMDALRRQDGSTYSHSPYEKFLGNVAYSFACTGESGLAVRSLKQAIQINKRHNSFDLASACAQTYARLGSTNEALEWTNRAIAMRTGEYRIEARAYLQGNLATALAESGARRQALTYARRAAKAAAAVRGRASDQAATIASVAEAFAACGDDAAAIAAADQALTKATAFRWNPRSAGLAKAAIAEAFAVLGRRAYAMEIAMGIGDDYARDDYARDHAYERLASEFARQSRFDQCLETARKIREEWGQSIAIQSAIQSLSPRSLRKGAHMLVSRIPHDGIRAQTLCWLALSLPSDFLEQAIEIYPLFSPGRDQAESAVNLAGAYGAALPDAFSSTLSLPSTPKPDQMYVAGAIARILVMEGEREEWKRVMRDAEIPDVEYAACGLSRVALAFAEAGWRDEALVVARRAAKYVARIGEGYLHGRPDAYRRLAWVMAHLGEKQAAVTYAEKALQRLARLSGSSSAFDMPEEVRRDLGVLLGKLMNPDQALATIIRVISPPGATSGYCDDAVFGLYEETLRRREAKLLAKLDAAISSNPALHNSPWLTARRGALHHDLGDKARGREFVLAALVQSQTGSADAVFDVIGIGATVIAAQEKMLAQVHAAIIEIEAWQVEPSNKIKMEYVR